MNHLPQINNVNSRRSRRGFTLVETIIAMGIITIMITAFLAAFGPAVQGIRKSISAKEANRLASTLEYEMSVLREGSTFTTSFEKAYDWIKKSGGGTSRNDIVLMYQYRGDVSSTNPDGTLEAYSQNKWSDGDGDGDIDPGIPGQNYVVQSVVRRLSDPLVEDELAPRVVEGRVFYVRMCQLVYYTEEDGEPTVLVLAGSEYEEESGNTVTIPGGLGEIIDPTEDSMGARDATTDHTDYPEAVIAFQAEFYVLKSSIKEYVDIFDPSDLTGVDSDPLIERHPKSTGKPIFTRNMAVRR